MSNKPTIELPRLEGESAKAHLARIEYVTMGVGRSIDKLADQRGSKSGSRSTTLLEWSRKYGWVDSARQYDEQVAYLTVQEAANKYRADLEAHRKKASEAGQALYSVAGQLLQKLNGALKQPKEIKGADGKTYTLHGIDLTANTLTIISRAMQTALDLEAHALGVDKLLPSLTSEDEE